MVLCTRFRNALVILVRVTVAQLFMEIRYTYTHVCIMYICKYVRAVAREMGFPKMATAVTHGNDIWSGWFEQNKRVIPPHDHQHNIALPC
jgi:hypothetical protein